MKTIKIKLRENLYIDIVFNIAVYKSSKGKNNVYDLVAKKGEIITLYEDEILLRHYLDENYKIAYYYPISKREVVEE